MNKIPIEISARHIHLSKKDLRALFGKGHILTKERSLTQPLNFAAAERLTIEKKGRKIARVRIVGPLRKKTQVELSLTDAFILGMEVPIRKSGNIKGSPGVDLIGPKGRVKLKQGVIAAWRHIHLNAREAKRLGVKQGQMVNLKTRGNRSLIFNKVKIRVGRGFKLCLHLDTDEGNAAGIVKKGQGILMK